MLLNQIETLRQQMISAGLLYGFGHDITINLSTKLDLVLNQFQK
ncbi:aspartyl-phosphate phosphatase Spo0E family protein [Bacillus massilinigeriensis]